MKKKLLLWCVAFSSFAYSQDSYKALYGIKNRFEQEIYKTVQTPEKKQIVSALLLADHTIDDFMQFLQENSLQQSTKQALYISGALHMHSRLKSEVEFLVQTMHTLQQNSVYWQKEAAYEQAPFYKKSIYRWGYSFGYVKVIQNHVKRLAAIKDLIAVQLGKYLYLLHEFEFIQTINDIEKISKRMMENDFFGEPVSIYISHLAIQSAYAFNEHSQNLHNVCQQVCLITKIPSYVERNKLACAATLLGSVVAGMVIYKNVDRIKNSAQDVQIALQGFIQDSVKGPIQKISDVFFNKNEAGRKSLEDSKFDLSGDIDLLHRIAKKHGYSLEGLSASQINRVILDVSEKENDYLTRALYVSSLMNPENAQNLLDVGSFKSTALIVDGKRSLNNAFEVLEVPLAEGNNILDQMKLMVPMMALSPAALLAWAGYKTTGGLYDLMFKKKFITQPFKDCLRMIHTLLNEHIHIQEKEYRAEGYLYCYTKILGIIGEKLSLQQQEIFYEDIALLQKYEYSYEQKFNIVQRMYTTYSFLHQ